MSSPTGVQYLHYGASGAPCSYPPYYNSVPSFMAYVRNGYLAAKAQSFNLFSFGLRTARYRNVGPIRTVAPLHYRQTSTFVGTRRTGQQIKGELIVDFFAVGAGVCGERQQVRSAPVTGYQTSIRRLRQIQSLIFGPR